MTLQTDYTLAEVADALKMSPRWLRQQIAAGAAHQRYGNRIRFTPEQVEELRGKLAAVPVEAGVTTRRTRRAS